MLALRHAVLLTVGTVALLASATAAESEYIATTSWNSLFFTKATSCDLEQLKTWSCEPCRSVNPGFKNVSVFNSEERGTRAFIGMDGERIIVAFRGSSNLQNWLDNLDTFKTTYPNRDCDCQVHEGFLASYNSMKDWLMNEMANLLEYTPNAEVLVAGHSLGGAQALLGSLDIATNQMGSSYPPKRVRVYTYGAPRVGDPAFALWSTKTLGQLHTRVTHLRDPVNHLPSMSMGFAHNPQEIWYPEGGNSTYIECKDDAEHEDDDCSNYIYPINVMDHMNYLGVCTGCTCDSATLQEMRKVRLSDEKLKILIHDANDLAKKRSNPNRV